MEPDLWLLKKINSFSYLYLWGFRKQAFPAKAKQIPFLSYITPNNYPSLYHCEADLHHSAYTKYTKVRTERLAIVSPGSNQECFLF